MIIDADAHVEESEARFDRLDKEFRPRRPLPEIEKCFPPMKSAPFAECGPGKIVKIAVSDPVD